MDESLQNYQILVEIFKGYLDTALTVHTSYYAFTGAIAAYYLANRTKRHYIKHALILPFFLGIALCIVSFNGMSQALTLQGKVRKVITELEMVDAPRAPPVDILWRALLVMGILDVVICASLLLLYFWPNIIFGRATNAKKLNWIARASTRLARVFTRRSTPDQLPSGSSLPLETPDEMSRKKKKSKKRHRAP
jgi:hypothetical protein